MPRTNSLSSKIVIMMLSLCLLLPGTYVFMPKTAEAATTVSISNGVTVSLYDAQLVKDESGKLAAFTLTFQNQSGSSVQLIDYWARINSGNNSFVTKLISEDKEKKVVIPNSTTYLTFYAYVDEKQQLTDLTLDIIKWDFGVNNYERIVGSLKSPTNGVTGYQKAEETNINKSLMNMMLSTYKMYSDEKYSYFNVDISVRNKSNSSLDMKNMAYYLSDGKGTLVPLESSTAELVLKPQERRNILLSSTVAKSFDKQNASVVVMYKDEAGGIQVPKVSFKLPVLADTPAAAASSTSAYQVNGTEIAVTVKDSSMSYSGSNAFVDTSIVLENRSSVRTSMPKFEYYIKTAQGYLYPLLPAEGSDTALLPKIKKQIDLRGEMPSDIDLTKSQFVLFLSEGEGTASYFLGNYKLSVGSNSEPTKPASNSVTYLGNLIEQTSLQRVPNGNSDLLIAEFKITNKDTKSKAKLQVAGQFEIDGVKISADATKVISLDKLVAIAPNQSYRVVTYTEIPYVQSTNDIVFSMSEQATSGAKSVHQFKVGSMTNAKLLGSNESYKIETLGGRGEVSLVNSTIYNGNQTDMFFAQLQYESKEQRAGIPTKLKGYISNSNGDIVELNVKNYEMRLLPNGKAIVNVWSVVPKNYEDKKINLYIGESINLAEDEIANVIINPVYMQHIYKNETPATTLTAMPFMNYDVSLSSMYAQFDSSNGGMVDTVNLSFNYDVVARENAPVYSDVQSIVVEYVDPQYSQVKFSKTFKVGETGEDALIVGRQQTASMTFVNPILSAYSPTEYKVNVYAQYQDHKKLIATDSFLFGNMQ